MVRVVCCLLLTGLPEPSIHKPCDYAPFLFPKNRVNRKNGAVMLLKVTERAEVTGMPSLEQVAARNQPAFAERKGI